ncbi:HPr family phosphocarrier protein [Pseudomonadales bacterium]|nr:HPr family phosphocarrier protein [Pseudomonadales bacterium]
MIEQQTTIQNKLGMHARAASKFVGVAQRFSADITVTNGDQTANGKSIMSMMILQASTGTVINIRADGEDEAPALEQIIALITNLFDEAE